jgi:hypothetical protein
MCILCFNRDYWSIKIVIIFEITQFNLANSSRYTTVLLFWVVTRADSWQIPTFRRNILFPSSGLNMFLCNVGALSTSLHDVTTQNNFVVFTAMRTLNLQSSRLCNTLLIAIAIIICLCKNESCNGLLNMIRLAVTALRH